MKRNRAVHGGRVVLPAILSIGCLLVMGLPGFLQAGLESWKMNGPYGGLVKCIAVDPSSPSTLYAGTNHGVYKSTDAGAHWSAIYSADEVPPGVSAIAIDPVSATTAYFGGNQNAILYKTIDGGGSWIDVGEGLNSRQVNDIAIDPSNPNAIFVAFDPNDSDAGLYKSLDGGVTWDPASQELAGMRVGDIAIDPTNPSTLYVAAGWTRVFKSTDGGQSWADLSSDLPWMTVTALALAPSAPTTLYAAYWGAGIYKTVDGGATWATTNLTEPYILSLAIDPLDPETLYAGIADPHGYSQEGIHKSTDGGRTWHAVSLGAPSLTAYDLAVVPSDRNTVYAGVGSPQHAYMGGAYKSSNAGVEWRAINDGINEKPVIALATDATSPLLAYAGTLAGIYKTTDGASSWIASGLADAHVRSVAIDPSDPEMVWAATSDGIFKSLDGGTTWTQTNFQGDPLFLDELALAPSDPSTAYAALDGGKHWRCAVYRTTDDGETWTDMGPSMDLTIIDALIVDPSSSLTVYASTYSSYRSNRSGAIVYKTTDGGETWTSANGNLIDLMAFALAIDPRSPNTIYAATWGNLFKSTNGGMIWGATGLSDYGDHAVRALVMHPVDPGTLFAGIDGVGVLMTEDGARTWRALPAGPPLQYARPLAVLHSNPPTLLAVTVRGVWSLTLSAHTRPVEHP